jgi:hypothetical protein
MTIKEKVIQEVNTMSDSEPILKEILDMIETGKPKRTFKGRPLVRLEDLKHMDDWLPPEPDNWETASNPTENADKDHKK